MLYSHTTLATAKLHYEINGIRGEIATNVKKRFDAKLAPLNPTLDKNKIQLFAEQALSFLLALVQQELGYIFCALSFFGKASQKLVVDTLFNPIIVFIVNKFVHYIK